HTRSKRDWSSDVCSSDLKRADTKFNTVEELEANPELAKPKFETIAWEVATYRGAIPISQEALDDSVANLTSIVQENIQEQKINRSEERRVGKDNRYGGSR